MGIMKTLSRDNYVLYIYNNNVIARSQHILVAFVEFNNIKNNI